jgi:hypothetical protein
MRKRELKAESKKPKYESAYTINLAKALKNLQDNGISPELEVEIEFEKKMENFLTNIKEIKKPRSIRKRKSNEVKILIENVDAPKIEVVPIVEKPLAMADDDDALLNSYLESLNQSTVSFG